MSKGVLYMFIAAMLFSLMTLCVKLLPHIPAVEIVFFRSLFSLVVSYAFLKRKRVSIWGTNKPILFLRGLSGAIALVLYFWLLQRVPLAAASSMQYLSPIFTAVLGVFILKERVTPLQYLFFVISFSGILIVQGFDTRVDWFDLTIGLTSAVLTGLAYNFVRKLKTTEHPLVIIMYFPLITIPISGFGLLFYWETPHGWDWMLLLLVGFFTQVAQYFLTRSYQLEEVGKVSIVNYTGLLYAIAFGFVIFGETYGWMSYVGMALIVAGVAFNLLLKKKL